MFKPVGTKLLVERYSDDTRTSSGIIISGNKPYVKGKVLDIGEKVTNITQGDVVYFPKNQVFTPMPDGARDLVVIDVEVIFGTEQ